MILTCEECHTRYLVAGHAVGPEGRRVRCTSCGHEWFVAPEEDEDVEEPEDIEPIPESVKPVPEGSELPVISSFAPDENGMDAGKIIGYAAAFMVFAAIFGVILAAHKPLARLWPASSALYDLAGMPGKVTGEGLIFDNITADIIKSESGMNVLSLKGTIMNLQTEPSVVPVIQASLLREDGEVADRWLVEASTEAINPHGEAVFESSYPEIPVDIRSVNVRFLAGDPPAPEHAAEEDVQPTQPVTEEPAHAEEHAAQEAPSHH